MKKDLLLVIVTVSTFVMYSFTTFNSRVDDIFKTLGIPAANAKDHIWKSFAGRYFSFPTGANIKNVPADKRVAAIQEIGAYIKEYLLSADFNKQYEAFREQRRPLSPATMHERIKAQIADYNQQLSESQLRNKTADPELKPLYEASIKMYKQLITSLENAYDPDYSRQIEGMTIQYDYDMGDYAYRMKQFEKEYPADVRAFIKLRLREFIQLSTNVDFNAQLVEKNGKKKFINHVYESKSEIWKYCFRAGKQSTEAARALAEQWLKEI
jgi:hypothetical protein